MAFFPKREINERLVDALSSMSNIDEKMMLNNVKQSNVNLTPVNNISDEEVTTLYQLLAEKGNELESKDWEILNLKKENEILTEKLEEASIRYDNAMIMNQKFMTREDEIDSLKKYIEELERDQEEYFREKHFQQT